MSAGMEGLRDEIAAMMRDGQHGSLVFGPSWADFADALLAPDGLLFPALRALGCIANDVIGATSADADVVFSTALAFLENYGITGPLADACLAAAEVEL